MSERPIVGARQLCTLLFLSLAVDMVIRSLAASGMPSAQKAIPAALLDAAIVSLLLIAPLRGQRLGTGAAWNGKAWGTKFLLFSAALLLAAAGAGAAARVLTLTVTSASGAAKVCMAVSAAFTTDFMKGSVGRSNISEKLTLRPSMRRSSSIMPASARFLPEPG